MSFGHSCSCFLLEFLTHISLFLRNKNCHWARIWVPVLSAPALVHPSPIPVEGEEPLLPCTGLPLLRRDLQETKGGVVRFLISVAGVHVYRG